jgi:hypothetical protein
MLFRCIIIFLGFSFFITSKTFAQPQKNDLYLRTNILSLLEPNAGGPSIGLEYFISDYFTLGTDVGVILYNPEKTEANKLGNPFGYKIKPEIRYYLYKKNADKHVRLFFGIEGLFLKTSTRNYNSLPILDNTGNWVYNYLGGYDEIKSVTGVVTKAGIQIPRFLLKKMLLEIYAGVGFRYKVYSYKNFPAGANIADRTQGWGIFNTDADGTYPSVSAGFKLVYKIH